MLINVFPKTLLGLARQTFTHRRLQPVLQPLVSVDTYRRASQLNPTERQLLHPDELAEALRFSQKRRQSEWLTVRICAKQAALHYSGGTGFAPPRLPPREIRIVKATDGRPSLGGRLPQELQHADLALSHGAGYGLALVADSRCGIDIQEPRDGILRVREKFCTAEEEEVLKNGLGELTELHALTLLWTVKEAGKKALSHRRMPGFLELFLSDVEPHAAGWVATLLPSSRQYQKYPQSIQVVAELYDQYGLALCLAGERIDA
ncbi:MAG: 4'-phosphopantetheinyl transferase family protein [Desulfopila sp.]